jgi:acylpyruvate hydrolase
LRFFSYIADGGTAVAVEQNGKSVALASLDKSLPASLDEIVRGGAAVHNRILAALASGHGSPVDRGSVRFLPPLARPDKLICVGLNYEDHAAETKLLKTAFPTIFLRLPSTMIGHGNPIPRAKVSAQYDYEVELTAVIGKAAHYVSVANALDHVAGYTIANDVSVRDYQFFTSQFTIGKNFAGTCPIGPDYVTADELPPGGKGLKLMTRLNGTMVQSDNTSAMIFDVATIVSKLSEVMALVPGDIILTGTPSGVGFGRKPPLWMKHDDVCECEIERIGMLRNVVRDEA